MPRLFVAIDLPEETKGLVKALYRELPGARWVPGQQLHLTLRFIGDTDQSGFEQIRRELESVRLPSFSLAIKGIGHFPPGRRARVLWVGIGGEIPLLVLQEEVERAVVAAGVVPEERPFSPHITIARLKEPVPGLERIEAQHALFASPPFLVSSFYLYSSVLGRDGATHRREREYPLSGTPGSDAKVR